MGMCIGCSPYNAEQSVITQAIAVLRRFGSDAHVYLPGVGMLNGLQAGNYLDSAGTTQGTVNQPVGLVLDAAGGFGVELVTNGDFSAGAAGWTISGGGTLPTISAGQLVFAQTDGQYSFCRRDLNSALVAGKTYMVSVACTAYTGGTSQIVLLGGTVAATTIPVGINAFSFMFVAVSANTGVEVSRTASSTLVASFDNISIREVTGIHAQQPTTSAKPILRRGAVNLLTYSGDFSNAVWVKGNVNPGSIVTGPTGLQNARQMQFIYSSPITRLYQDTGVTSANGTKYTFAVWLRSAVNVNINVGVERSGPADGESVVAQITPSWQLVTFSHSGVFSGASAVRAVVFSYDVAFNASLEVGPLALFQGTYTAAQIQALGGIPTTLTAPVSTALGAYWWDTSGSKSLVATFPAGNESVTVINATPTGQVTTTDQNVVGAYSINTNTNGRIIVNGVLTASELALLQRFANRLAGL